jgi:hypothetical protein
LYDIDISDADSGDEDEDVLFGESWYYDQFGKLD